MCGTITLDNWKGELVYGDGRPYAPASPFQNSMLLFWSCIVWLHSAVRCILGYLLQFLVRHDAFAAERTRL